MGSKKINHVIFDMDGLILDTEIIYSEVTQKMLNLYGDKTLTWDVQSKLFGTQYHEEAEIVIKIYDLPVTVEQYLELSTKLILNLMVNAQLMPGAEKLIRHLHEHKIPICLATSSSEPFVKVKTKNHKDLFSLFNHSVIGSTDPEVKKGKPSPDIFLIAASRFPNPPNPENCLVFEDATNGVKAAISAGMQVVMVPDPRCPEEERKLATCVLNSLEDIKLEEFGLPPYN